MGNPDFSLYTINILNALKKPKQSYATTDFTYLKKTHRQLKIICLQYFMMGNEGSKIQVLRHHMIR